MPITDVLHNVSDAQALTASAVSTNTIDLLHARELGQGHKLRAHVSIDVALAGTTPTLMIQVIQSDQPDLSGYKEITRSDDFAQALVTAGAIFIVEINPFLDYTGERYFGLRYVLTGGTPTVTLSSWFLMEYSGGKNFYSSGFSVT